MRHPLVKRLVLDAHGVVFNAPLQPFLRTLAGETGQRGEELRDRWRSDLRLPAWTGAIDDAELWRSLEGEHRPRRPAAEWNARLEALYEPGPAAAHLETWSRTLPVWMLSNHRSHWLLPRLERFGWRSLFERIFVSDAIQAVKPSADAFAPLLATELEARHTLYVDDQLRNVQRAQELGLQALQLGNDAASLARIEERLLGAQPSTA